MPRVCITERRPILQNLDSAQPLAGYFFLREEKKCVSASISATRIAGFTDFDLNELWQLWLQPDPHPDREVFTGRVFQSLNVIEVMVVELL
jgi:hypothetical protein